MNVGYWENVLHVCCVSVRCGPAGGDSSTQTEEYKVTGNMFLCWGNHIRIKPARRNFNQTEIKKQESCSDYLNWRTSSILTELPPVSDTFTWFKKTRIKVSKTVILNSVFIHIYEDFIIFFYLISLSVSPWLTWGSVFDPVIFTVCSSFPAVHV